MDRDRVPGAASGHRRRGHRAKKASPGLRIVERDGHWHVTGTLRVAGISKRLRRSTELPARDDTREDAEALRLKIEEEIRAEAIHGIKPSVPFSIAARDYLNRKRKRPLGANDVRIVKELAKVFRVRVMRTISDDEWIRFIDKRHAGNKAETRERYLNTVVSFLTWCRKRGWVNTLPPFDRDKAARNPNRRSRRRIGDLRPDLILFMLEHASFHLKPQIAVEWSTGVRVSNMLFGTRLCDLNLGEGRESITFHDTKNGTTVMAALHPWAADRLREYLKLRGKLNDREKPLFLDHRNVPYTDNGRAWGGYNRTAFNAMKRRAIKALLRASVRARRRGEPDRAGELKADARLIRQVTQHWFRHLLADTMLKDGGDVRSVMEQGGWLDPRSVIGYTRDVQEHRRALVNKLRIGEMDEASADGRKAGT